MLNYAPDGMAGGGFAAERSAWNLTWHDHHPQDDSVLLQWIAAAKLAASHAILRPQVAKPAPAAPFQYELMSGFCASS